MSGLRDTSTLPHRLSSLSPQTPTPWPTVGLGDAPGSVIWGLAHSGLEDRQLAFDGSLNTSSDGKAELKATEPLKMLEKDREEGAVGEKGHSPWVQGLVHQLCWLLLL